MKTKSLLSFGVPALALASLVTFSIGANEPKPVTNAVINDIKKSVPAKAHAEPKAKRKVLVFSKTNGWRHDSIPIGCEAMKILGEKSGAYEAVVSDDLKHFEADKIKNFDAIVFLNTTGEIFQPHPEELKKMSKKEQEEATKKDMELRDSLMSFIKSGKGFVGIHSATDTNYTWPEYGEMINGYFDGHPWVWNSPVQIDVEAGQEKHPIVSMLDGKPFEFQEEIYQLKQPYDSSKVHMLLRLNVDKSAKVKDIKRTDKDYGIAWIRKWGEGRVFYCSIGHRDDMYWNEKVMSHYLAGIQWAIGDLEAPVDK